MLLGVSVQRCAPSQSCSTGRPWTAKATTDAATRVPSRRTRLTVPRQFLVKCRVIATCRNPASAEALQALQSKHSPDRLSIYRMDVTKPDEITQCAEQVKASTPYLNLVFNVAAVLHIPGVAPLAPPSPARASHPATPLHQPHLHIPVLQCAHMRCTRGCNVPSTYMPAGLVSLPATPPRVQAKCRPRRRCRGSRRRTSTSASRLTPSAPSWCARRSRGCSRPRPGPAPQRTRPPPSSPTCRPASLPSTTTR